LITSMDKKKLNTIYIISKGRPRCTTAKTLTKMNYPGEWFIVCGNNDNTISEYKEIWGEKRVIVFDWYEEVKTSDLLDNFGVENMGSGCVPARNAVRKISESRDEIRYWMFDDDYNHFYCINSSLTKWVALDGKQFEDEIYKLALYADRTKMINVGFSLGSDTRIELAKTLGHRVFNAHNLSNDPELQTEWRGRMNEDLINAIDTYRSGGYELFVKYLMITMASTQTESGGNTEIYLADGTVRKAAYAIMKDPKNVILTVRHGRYHHKCNWRGVIPKVINEKYK
jgi:hypothetical protein